MNNVSAPASWKAMQATLTKLTASATTTTNAINGLFPYFAHPSTEERTMADISGLIEWEAELTKGSPEVSPVQTEVTSVPPQLWKHPEEATREQLLFMHTRILERSVKESKKSAEANRRLEVLERKIEDAKYHLWWANYYLGMGTKEMAPAFLRKAAEFLKNAVQRLSA